MKKAAAAGMSARADRPSMAFGIHILDADEIPQPQFMGSLDFDPGSRLAALQDGFTEFDFVVSIRSTGEKSRSLFP